MRTPLSAPLAPLTAGSDTARRNRGRSAKSVDGASTFSYPLPFLPFLSSTFVSTESVPPVTRFAAHQSVTVIVDSIPALLAQQPVDDEL